MTLPTRQTFQPSPTFGDEFQLPDGVDLNKNESVFQVSDYIFGKVKSYLEGGGILEMPVYVVIFPMIKVEDLDAVQEALERGEDVRGTDIKAGVMVVDQTPINLRHYLADTENYNVSILAAADRHNAFMVAQVCLLYQIPEEDREAWKDRHFDEHPNHWLTLDISIQGRHYPNHMVCKTAKVIRGATCNHVEEPQTEMVLRTSAQSDKSVH